MRTGKDGLRSNGGPTGTAVRTDEDCFWCRFDGEPMGTAVCTDEDWFCFDGGPAGPAGWIDGNRRLLTGDA